MPQTPAPRFCPDCGRAVPAGDSFCGGCGARIVAAGSARTARPSLQEVFAHIRARAGLPEG